MRPLPQQIPQVDRKCFHQGISASILLPCRPVGIRYRYRFHCGEMAFAPSLPDGASEHDLEESKHALDMCDDGKEPGPGRLVVVAWNMT